MKYVFLSLVNLAWLSAAVAYQKPETSPSISDPPAGQREAQTQTSAADLRGIYVDSNVFPLSANKAAELAASLTVSGVDGLVLVLGWNHIEPAKGKYQWDTLDTWMSRATLAGKKVDLSVRAGTNTPSWLFKPEPTGAGARPLGFSTTRSNGSKGVCSPDTIAAPWDTAFLAQWDSMLAALATHLKSVGTYGAVTILRLTGINRDTDELHLPAQTAQSTGLACVSDAVTTWHLAGYRPSLLLQGWDAITNSFRKNFPDKCFSVAIIAVTSPFPAIAEDGSVIKGTSPESLSVSQNLPLLMLASQKFPGHLVIQNNTLYPAEPAQPQTIHAALSLGAMIAFQTNEELAATYGGAACGGRGDTTACIDTTFLEMLETGIYPLGKTSTVRAQYIEVFAANVNSFPQATWQAHLELLPSDQVGVTRIDPKIPLEYSLQQCYPNPFNPSTTIRYGLPQKSQVSLMVYNTLGQLVSQLVSTEQEAGFHEVRFDASGLSSGVYFYRIIAGEFVLSRKLVLLK